MKKFWIMIPVVAVAACIWWYVTHRIEAKPATVAAFKVERGDVADTLQEVGELVSQDPILLQAPFTGELKWLLQDGTWVQKGEQVLIFNEEDLVKQVTTLRSNVVDKQQNLQLARLNADHARVAELQRVENAKEALKLAAIRHRILTTEPKGGDQLIKLDAEIRPIEKKLAELQSILQPLETRYRESRDKYIAALQAWQEGRGRLLEAKAGANLKQLTAEAGGGEKNRQEPGSGEKGPPRERRPRKAPGAPPAAAPEGTAATAAPEPPVNIEDQVAALQAGLAEARKARDADRGPYETALAAVDAVDADAQELYIQIEIEKRGLPATRLVIDRDIAKLQLAEAERQVESGKRALAVGAISKSRCDTLIADAVAAAGRLEILEYRLEIASRPATEDQVAASEAALAAAQRAVDNAKEIFDREIAIREGEIKLVAAQLEKARGDLDRTGKGFAKAIEGNIKMLESELALLTEEDAARRTEIVAEIDQLKVELTAAVANPPHIVLAPSDGLVRLRTKDDELTAIGDRWDRGNTVAMLYPPGNMTVKAGINEVNFRRIRSGMNCRVDVPALNMVFDGARVAHISQIGRDRIQSESRWQSVPESGIIEFSLSVELGREVEGFRQGMTVLLEIETDRRSNVLHLPAAAVQSETDGYSVLIDPALGTRKPVQGELFGDNLFVVTGGLNEGDTIYRVYGGQQ